MAAGDDAHVERFAGFGDALAWRGQRAGDAGVERVAERLAQVDQLEGVVERVEQHAFFGGVVV